MMPKTEWRTAAESMAEAEKNPEFVAMRDAQEVARRTLEEKLRAEEEPLLADLRAVGYRLGSVWDLVNTADSYPEAIPLLLDHLRRPYSDRLREGIARALAVREARGIAGPAVIDVLRKAGDADPYFRWSLANALTIVADRTTRDDIKALIDSETDDNVRTRLKRALKTAAKPS